MKTNAGTALPVTEVQTASPLDLSIIIINWNSCNYLSKCLFSIYANPPELNYEVVVLDSGSHDGCGEMIAENFPLVRFFQHDENLGFARANNLAVKSARGAALLFLNPDTEVYPNAISGLFALIRSQSDSGAIGARLLNSDGSLQTSSVQAFPTILNQLLTTDLGIRLFPFSPLWGRAPLFRPRAPRVEAEVISGAALMMRKELFDAIGGFCEAYFMYYEDVELCLRAARLGFKNYYVADSCILHHGGGSSRTQPSIRSILLKSESAQLYFKRTSGKFKANCYRVGVLIGAIGRLSLLAPAFIAVKVGRLSPSVINGRFLRLFAAIKWSLYLNTQK